MHKKARQDENDSAPVTLVKYLTFCATELKTRQDKDSGSPLQQNGADSITSAAYVSI